MGAVIDLTDQEWDQVADLFDPPGRRGAPEVYPRRLMVEAMLWMARTGIQWRYLPARFPPWTAVWSEVAALAGEHGLGEGDGPTRADHPDGPGSPP